MFKEHIIYWPDTEIEVWGNELDLDSSIVESGIKHANAKGVPFGIRSPLGKIEEPTGEETRISAKPEKTEDTLRDIMKPRGPRPEKPEGDEDFTFEDYLAHRESEEEE
jgi:hypothetical protein